MDKGDDKGSFYWVGESNDPTQNLVKHRRKQKPKKLEFIGWCSKSLLEFLQSIGKETDKELSQHNVTAIVNDYVNNFNLLHPVKKKRVVCDERLHSLFGKKSIPRIKIHELLNPHFADNHDSSEDDHLYGSDEFEDADVTSRKQKVYKSEEKSPTQKKLLSQFAAIVPENIKLLYLKRSLVQELVKQPESFEEKLLGGYIRIKSDPLDFSQKNSHQLHPVTGVKNVPVDGSLPDGVLIQVPNMPEDISICKLSDDDFSKEEIDDLCRRVKDGLLKRPTVVEVEHKVHILHEDIIKHWLPREIAHLQNLIDRANEKGWRKAITLFEYLERKKRLQTPSEQSKLLTEVPKVIADKLDPEASTPQEQLQLSDEILVHGPHAEEDEPVAPKELNKGDPEPTKNACSGSRMMSFEWVEDNKQRPETKTSDPEPTKKAGSRSHLTSFEWVEDNKQRPEAKTSNPEPRKNAGSGSHFTSFEWVEDKQQRPETKTSGPTVDLSNVIELSDDDEETHVQASVEKIHEPENEYEFCRPKWFYVDPQGQTQGPFSGADLKRWSDAGYFSPDFKVWKDGQTPDQAILVTHMLSFKQLQ